MIRIKLIRTVRIVSSQSDSKGGKINQHSAIGRTLIGGRINEEIEVSLPDGVRTLLITDIRKFKSSEMVAG